MIYLDNSATTRPFDSVVDVMGACMRDTWFNPSAAYKPAVDVDRQMRLCRQTIARQLGAQEDEVVFTGGGTESDNLAILGFAETLHGNANFLVSAIEHPAVSDTIQRVKKLGIEVREMPIDSRGVVDLTAAQELMDEHTALLSCMQVSNETGAIQPIEALSRMVRERNPKARVHVDGVQGFMRVPMHMGRMGVDMYALSGHKIHGPKGVGALVVRKGMRLVPQITGGGQEKNLRSGTYNAPAILGLGKAVQEMAARQTDVEKLRELKACLLEKLEAQIPGIRVNGPRPDEKDSAPHILSISFDGVRGEVMRNALEGADVLVSTGSACASHKQKVSGTLRAMGLSSEMADGTVRISLGLDNTMEEMEITAAHMAKMAALLAKYRRR
ncbi:MAG: cysteine desulfurase [Clostridia bacterium]|nr:cysteine desulfurase [Clostridia bacterium]